MNNKLKNRRTIDQIDLKDKKVIIRVDFNVPMLDGKIVNNKRIVESLPTINKALESGAKVILLSHLGRIKSSKDKSKTSLKPVAEELSKLLNKNVKLVPATSGQVVKNAVKDLKSGDIIMLENTRWEDLNNNAESNCNVKLAKFWASLADVFVNDAFGTSHRKHASNYGIAQYVKETAIGYLIKNELETISKVLENNIRPSIAIIGGAKVSDKIKAIDYLLTKVDRVIIGGGMAHTFWKAQGLSLGITPYEEDQVKLAKEYLKKYQERLVLPVDSALSPKFENIQPIYNKFNSLEIPSKLMAMDIGSRSINLFKNVLNGSKTVIWNGPLGVCEFGYYSVGTQEIAKAISELPGAFTIIGGGDSIAAIQHLGLDSKFSHISTGGGACLKLLEGSDLPAVSIIQDIKGTRPTLKQSNTKEIKTQSKTGEVSTKKQSNTKEISKK